MQIDQLLNILENTLTHRHNIYMFYTIIVTTVAGFAFTPTYKSLNLLPKIAISIGVGIALWVNLFALAINTLFVQELMTIINSEIAPNSPVYKALNTGLSNRYNVDNSFVIMSLLYGFINLAVGFALWWEQLKNIGVSCYNRVKNDNRLNKGI